MPCQQNSHDNDGSECLCNLCPSPEIIMIWNLLSIMAQYFWIWGSNNSEYKNVVLWDMSVTRYISMFWKQWPATTWQKNDPGHVGYISPQMLVRWNVYLMNFAGDGFSYTQSRFSQNQDLCKITNKTVHILIRLSVYNCYTITILHK